MISDILENYYNQEQISNIVNDLYTHLNESEISSLIVGLLNKIEDKSLRRHIEDILRAYNSK